MRKHVLKNEHFRQKMLAQFHAEFSAESKLMQQLFKDPYTEYSLSELAGLAGVSKSIVGSIVNGLKEQGLATVVELRYVHRIRSNYENFAYISRKISYNLDVIYRSNIVLALIEAYKKPKAIILFGSFRQGQDGPGSDIDIAVEVSAVENYDLNTYAELFSQLEEFTDRKLSIRYFTREQIADNVFTNIANGIVLYGFLEVHK